MSDTRRLTDPNLKIDSHVQGENYNNIYTNSGVWNLLGSCIANIFDVLRCNRSRSNKDWKSSGDAVDKLLIPIVYQV